MNIITPTSLLTRAAPTTQYTANDFISNSETAGSALASFTWSLAAGRGSTGFLLRNVRLRKSTATVTVATFALHLFGANKSPLAMGDNVALAFTNFDGFIGSIALDMATGSTVNIHATTIFKNFPLTQALEVNASTVYGYLQAIGAYAPGASEVFECQLGLEG